MKPFCPLPFLLLLSALPAQATDIARIFPPSTLAYAEFQGLKACVNAGEQAGVVRLGRHLFDSAGKEVLTQMGLLENGLSQVAAGLHEVGLTPSVVRDVMQGQWAVGVGRPVVFDDTTWPSICIAFDSEDRSQSADAIQQVWRALMAGRRLDLQVFETERKGAKVTTWSGPGLKGSIALARAGRHVLLANSPYFLDECLDAMAGGPSFAEDEMLKEQRRLDGKGLLSALLRIEPLIQGFAPFVPYDAVKMFEVVGAGTPRALSFVTGVRDGSAFDRLRLSMQVPEQGFLMDFAGTDVTTDVLRYCGKDTVAIAGLRMKPEAVGEAYRRMLAALQPGVSATMHQRVAQGLGQLRSRLDRAGLSQHPLEKVLENFGPDMVLVTTLPAVFPDFTLYVRLKDKAIGEALMQVVEQQASGLTWREQDFEGTKIRFTSTRTDFMALAPSYAFHDDWLIVSSQLRVLKAALAQAASGSSGLPGADTMAARMKGSGALQFHGRTEVALDKLWGLASTGLSALISRFGTPDMDPDIIPNTEEMRGYLGDVHLSMRIDGGGVTLTQVQPTGLGATLSAFGTILDAALAATASHVSQSPEPTRTGDGKAPPKRRIY